MERLHFEIEINAPVAKVWEAMLGEQTYKQWTAAFMPGATSTFEGSWQKGETIRFISLDENGSPSGMLSKIADNRPHQFISIEHVGIVQDGKDITSGPEVEGWAGALENYTFEDLGEGKTKLTIDVDASGEFKDDMQQAWPKALAELKKIAEA